MEGSSVDNKSTQLEKFSRVPFDFSHLDRKPIWEYVIQRIEDYLSNTDHLKVSPALDLERIRKVASRYTFDEPKDLKEVIDYIIQSLEQFTVHTPHPHYMGLFNPRTTYPSMLGDLIAAVYNPQMAAWSHAPFPNEVELYIIKSFGEKVGYDNHDVDGVFTSGGAEANLTALQAALNAQFPAWSSTGIRGLEKSPVFYVSEESHHSFVKAATICGLGREAVRIIPADDNQAMDVKVLDNTVRRDVRMGKAPFLIVATLGTTGSGGIDPVEAIYSLCKEFNLWLHADAAWAGVLTISSKYKHLLGPIHLSDSVTIDAHKWLSVPMGAGMFITRHNNILDISFRTQNQYMPRDAQGAEVTDPYNHSVQWSRRFTGLKVFFSLLSIGWEGYEQQIEKDFNVGDYFRDKLKKTGWEICNHSALPVVCFRPAQNDYTQGDIVSFCKYIIKDGRMWISVYPIQGQDCLRACITNYNTGTTEIDAIVSILNELKIQFFNIH
ncbi:MAG TPA: aminotransferase class V-fold PLP-dependent enzyme [Saprospiraceae bacterium]|nr:aminotransferase class V-fold PLP-dependent enzyme [Saprospiraceae bacterium]